MRKILSHVRWPRPRTGVPVAAGRERPQQSSDTRPGHHAALVHLSRLAFTGSPSISLLGDVCRIAARVLNADHVHVAELLPDRRTLIVRAAAGWPPERIVHWQMNVSPESRLGQVLRTGGLMLLDQTSDAECPDGGGELLRQVRMHSGLAAGIAPVSEARAVLGVYSVRARRFSREDLQFVRAVAQIVESTLQRAADMNSHRAAREASQASQADLLRIVVGRLRPAIRESVEHLWSFRSQRPDAFSFRRAVKQTERQVAAVADFIEDLSLLADLLDGRVPARRIVPLAPILASLVDHFTDRAARAGVFVSLSIADDFVATAGDSALLRRALFNLIDNALQFTGPEGFVAISVSTPDASAVVIDITDSGRGMTATELERLWRHQDGAQFQQQGPGLGWRLASAVIHAHGGTLAAASAGLNRGSVISVRLRRIDSENC